MIHSNINSCTWIIGFSLSKSWLFFLIVFVIYIKFDKALKISKKFISRGYFLSQDRHSRRKDWVKCKSL